MFKFFSKKKSVNEILEDVGLTSSPNTNWLHTTVKDKDGKDIPVQELVNKYNRLSESVEHLRGEANKFYKENQKLNEYIKNLREQQNFLHKENQKLENLLKSIEEDGTEEHNAAIKLREENAQLKVEIENWRTGVKHWKELYDEKANYVDELVKEVNGLRHLKEENVDLIERVNEIDSDMNKEYQAEISTLKNDIAVLKNRNFEILKMYNGMVTQGGLKYMEAKLQIVQNNYTKCSKERDEFKHQLNAAEKEIDQLKRWKKEQLTVQSWWDKVDSYVRDHDDAPLGGIVANTCLNFLKERDELKAEVKKLKEDIVDYVIKKDDEVNELKRSENYYVCNHCGYKVAHNTNQWGGCACCKDGLMIEKEVQETVDTLKNMKTQGFEDYDPSDFEEPQKHPMYPIHWGGYEKKTTAETLEEKFDKGEGVLDYFNKVKVTTNTIGKNEEWKCPCNICKEGKTSWEEAASDLALRVVKLEKQIEELKLINIQSATRRI